MAASDISTPVSHRSADWLQYGFLAALLMACAIALSPNNVDPDLWGHVQYGADALAAGELHRTATHTYTAPDHRWVNHENLSELALSLGYRHLGPRGLLIAKCLLGLAVMGLMLRAAKRNGIEMPVACAFLLLVATALTSFWAMRPQLASYVLLAMMVVLLDRAFKDWHSDRRVQVRWLWLAPPLFAVWTNSHGAFVAGVCLFIAYLGLRSLEALWHDGRKAWWLVAHFAVLSITVVAATFVTPYGPDLLVWLLESLRHPRPEISEWAPPGPSEAFFFPFVLLMVVTLLAWLLTDRRRDWVHVVLVSLCIWQSCLHSRHIALFAILAGFWLPIHVQSLLARLRKGAPQNESPPLSANARRWIALGLTGVFMLLVFKLGTRLADFPVQRDEYPVDAIAFMAEEDLGGKLVVSFNWAQYAIAALAPDVQVAFDGRFRTCYPQEVIDMHFDFLLGDVPGKRFRSPASGEIDGHRILHYKQPDLVLIDRRFRSTNEVMQQQDDFVLLYQDALAQVWGRRERYDNPAGTQYVADSRRRIRDEIPTGSVTWPALPASRGPEIVSHDQSTVPPSSFAEKES